LNGDLISVIIVTWNNEDDINDCITSIFEQNNNEIEIVCIDNNSTDKTKEFIRNYISTKNNITLIENSENTGFTFATNQGIAASKGDFIFLLNPDTILKQNSLYNLYKEIKGGKEKAVVPMILNEDGSIQESCRNLPGYRDIFFEIFLISRIFPKSKFFSRWKNKYFDYNNSQYAEQPMAAAFLIEKGTLNLVGNFDSRYYMFFNDVDLCKKLFDKKINIKYLKEAMVIHKKGTSIFRDRKNMISIWNKDCLRYFEKFYGKTLNWYILLVLLKITGFFRKLFA
jgi:GT2 family glycosyltransferase